MEKKVGKKYIPIINHTSIPKREVTYPEKLEFPIHVKPKYPYKPNKTCIVGFYIYPKCNVRCDYCFWFRDIDLEKRMDVTDWTRIIDEISKREDVHLLLIGGEPTFNPELPQIVEYAISKGIKDIQIGTNFTRDLDYYLNLPRQDICKINITIHTDIFKNKSDEEYHLFLDKIMQFYETDAGKNMRIGFMLDNRYFDRVLYALEKFKDLKIMKYPVIPTYETYEYYKVTPENIEKAKPYFHEAFRKYKINGEERDWLDDHHNDGPVFTGYWCNANSLEVFADGTARITCLDKVIGNLIDEDDVIKNFNPLSKCTAPFCDNFNRVLLKKVKYGKHT